MNRTGEGPRTGPLLATPRASLPAAPTGIAAAAGDGEVSLRWVDPLDASITGYAYSIDGGAGWRSIAGSGPETTSYTVTGLTNGTAYAFAVRAVNAAGDSPSSIAVPATPAASAPAKPSGLTAAAGDAAVGRLGRRGHHQAPVQPAQRRGAGGMAGHPPERSRRGQRRLVHGGGPVNDTAYTFAVRAVNATASGPPSDPVTAVPRGLAPAKPSGLTAAAGNGQVTLRWDDPDDAGITRYQYRRQERGGAFGEWTDIAGSGAGTTSHTVSGLTNGAVYTFEVRAVNGSGKGTPSDAVRASPTYPPGRPSGLTASAGDGRVALGWDYPFDGTITGYEYQQQEAGGEFGAWTEIAGSGPDTTAHTVSGLTNGAVYTFRIRAVNGSGNSEPSLAAAAAPAAGGDARGVPEPPGAAHPARPLGLTAAAGDGEAALTWTDPGDAAITKYQYNLRLGRRPRQRCRHDCPHGERARQRRVVRIRRPCGERGGERRSGLHRCGHSERDVGGSAYRVRG